MTATQPVALVTGASSGIGKAASLALAQAGFEVIGTSRYTSQVTPRDGVTFLDLDVTSDESVTTAVKQVIAHSGRKNFERDDPAKLFLADFVNGAHSAATN